MLDDGISITVENQHIKKEFLFDIMNNPKSGQPFNQAHSRLDNNSKFIFSDIYHTIGNFTPVQEQKFQRIMDQIYN